MACDLEQSTSLLQSLVTTQDFGNGAESSPMDASDSTREVGDDAGPFGDVLGGVLNSAIEGLVNSDQLDEATKTLSDITERVADICENATSRLRPFSGNANCTTKTLDFRDTAAGVSQSWSVISNEIQSKLGKLKTVLEVIQNVHGMREFYSKLTDVLDEIPSMCNNVSIVIHNASMIDAANCENLTGTFNHTSSTVSAALGKLENMSADNLTSDLDSKMAHLIEKLWKKLDVPKLVSDLQSLPVFLEQVVSVSADISACLHNNASYSNDKDNEADDADNHDHHHTRRRG